MKEEILKRAMFAMPLSKEAKNSGILSGFDLDEMEEMEEPGDGSEDMPQMSRTPQNPEILMNNLRGDYRSVDARYLELAQMVGEEAAMETPPEVLAMLQMQLGAMPPAQGIGALPQAQGMMPPGAMPPGPQQPMMPPGMEGGMPPFPQGGAEEAPPTPDGLPPIRAAGGAFINPLTRFAQMGADKLGTLATEANVLGGQLMTRGLPNQFPAVFENLRGPGGRFIAEQTMKYPTLTQHLSGVVGPRATAAVERLSTMGSPAAKTAAGVIAASGLYKTVTGASADPERDALTKAYEEAYYQKVDRSVPMPSISNLSTEQLKAEVNRLRGGQSTRIVPPAAAPGAAAAATAVAPGAAAAAAPAGEGAAAAGEGAPAGATAAATPGAAAPASVTDFIRSQFTAAPGATPASRMERIKAAQKDYVPLYKELLGDTQDDMYRNAMLMLADAGFKYASLPAKSGTTPISLLATAAQGIPQGFMALMAQAKDRQLKLDTAALSQAVNDVQEQDKYAQRLKEIFLQGDFSLLREREKKIGDIVLEDGGAGLIVSKTKNGSFLGTSLDPKNPTVQSAITSRWTLRDTDNPFVVNRGQAPTSTETDKGERVKLTSTLRGLDNSLATLDNLKGVYTQAYGPGAWFSDKVNNLLVPILPTAVVRPDVNLTDAATRISTGMNSILKNLAAANDSGRVAVQEQEWARETAKGVTDPTKFFADKELVAKQFASMEAMLRNGRQQVLTQLGYEGNDYVMNTPNTGTKSDPFSVPADPEQQKRMFTFLGSTIGKLQDPRAQVYLRLPNGTVQSFNPTQLQGLIK
jgi:hypothetical protein